MILMFPCSNLQCVTWNPNCKLWREDYVPNQYKAELENVGPTPAEVEFSLKLVCYIRHLPQELEFVWSIKGENKYIIYSWRRLNVVQCGTALSICFDASNTYSILFCHHYQWCTNLFTLISSTWIKKGKHKYGD